MKDKAPIIVLIIVAIGLGMALIVVNNKSEGRKDQSPRATIKTLSNDVNRVQNSLDEQISVNRTLETNLATTTAEYSNKLAARTRNWPPLRPI